VLRTPTEVPSAQDWQDGERIGANIPRGLDIAVVVGRGLLGLTWEAVRLPVFALLVILEPIVRVVLCGLALLSALAALFFEFLTELPKFPFWGMLGFSVGCALALLLYYGLVRIFSQA
jgi:hypothetical protein